MFVEHKVRAEVYGARRFDSRGDDAALLSPTSNEHPQGASDSNFMSDESRAHYVSTLPQRTPEIQSLQSMAGFRLMTMLKIFSGLKEHCAL